MTDPHGHRWKSLENHVVMPQYYCLNRGCDFDMQGNRTLVTTLPDIVHDQCKGDPRRVH